MDLLWGLIVDLCVGLVVEPCILLDFLSVLLDNRLLEGVGEPPVGVLEDQPLVACEELRQVGGRRQVRGALRPRERLPLVVDDERSVVISLVFLEELTRQIMVLFGPIVWL